MCRQFFCNIYFQQCQRAGCLGCLNHLRGLSLFVFFGNFKGENYDLDLNFAPRHLTNLVNDNPVESQIVQVKFIIANEFFN